jgi:ATP-binding cassette subfamily B multidrug efflux pump
MAERRTAEARAPRRGEAERATAPGGHEDVLAPGENAPAGEVLRWANGFARGLWGDAALAVSGAVVASALALVPPYLAGRLVTDVLQRRTLAPLVGIVALALAASLVRGAAAFAQAYLSERFGQGVLVRLRDALYHHLTGMAFADYDRMPTGQLMSRVTGDTEWVNRFYANIFTQGAATVFTLLFVFAAVFAADRLLGLVLLLLFPALAVLAIAFHRQVRPAFRAIRRRYSALSTRLQESLSGVRVMKAFAQEEAEGHRFSQANDAYRDANVRAERLWARYFPLMDLSGGVYGAVVLVVGGLQVIHGQVPLGRLVAAAGDVLLLVQPLRALGPNLNLVEQAVTAGGRLRALMALRPALAEPARPVVRPRREGEVRFEHVSFAYGDGEPVLVDVDFHLPARSSLAVVGATGSGKSTLVSLVGRLYDVQRGRVLLDGVDVRDLALADLRRSVAYVLQEPFLFSATVAENIAYARPDADREEIEEAARVAQADAFIRRLPKGYDTLVGERGIGLSGGQRQRIALARAYLAQPEVLVLDDAWSSVDLQTEHAIQRAIAPWLRERTAIVVAHRLSTVRGADLILFLDRGRVVGRGRHEELWAGCPPYRAMFEHQAMAWAKGGRAAP